jgi:rSAM/selenodomain-associated transferase 1
MPKELNPNQIDEADLGQVELSQVELSQVGLGIFAKTAQLSPVKTRLANSIGVQKADQFYQLSVQAIEQLALALPSQIHPHWAIAEADGLGYAQWQNLPHFWTGAGDLGARLHQVYTKLLETHDAAMLIGTDSPQLTPSLLQAGQDQLRKKPASIVIGPCSDGGFYLFAGGMDIPKSFWNSVTYSQSTTLSQMIVELEKRHIEVVYLPEQQDVDVEEDLSTLRATLSAQPHLLPAQRQLLNWLSRTASTT